MYMRRLGLRRIVKPAFVVCLGMILYLIATNSGAGWLYVVAAGIGGVVAVAVPLPWWNVRGIEVVRRAPVLATAGEPFECSLEIRSTGRLARHLLEVEDHFAGDTGRAVAVRVRRDKPEVLRYTVENPRRGIYAGGEVVVESGAPFGLFYGRRRKWAAYDIVVYPRTFDVAGAPPSADAGGGGGGRGGGSIRPRGRVLGRKRVPPRGSCPLGRLEAECARPPRRKARHRGAGPGDASALRGRAQPRRPRPARGP